MFAARSFRRNSTALQFTDGCVRIVVLLMAVLATQIARAETNLFSAEYFWDVVPSAGAGSLVNFTPGQSATFGAASGEMLNANVSGLISGLHQLGFRVKDDSKWSEVYWLPVQVLDAVTANAAGVGVVDDSSQELTTREYFWDTDPGLGAGSPATITRGESFASAAFLSANVTGLAAGLHRLGLRARDASGKWSDAEWLPIQVLDAVTGNAAGVGVVDDSSRELVAAEYFWDSDPSVAVRTSVTIARGESFASAALFDAAVVGLNAGSHRLGFRVQDPSGRWSEVEWLPIEIRDSVSLNASGVGVQDDSARELIGAEYFWDQDPGASKGTALPVEAAQTVLFGLPGTNLLSIGISQLDAGQHRLGLRVKEASGAWSGVEWTPIGISGAPITSLNGKALTNNVVLAAAGDTFQASLETPYRNGLILYTTDGSDPGNGTFYAGPFTVTAPFSIRAVAFNPDDFSDYGEADPVSSLIIVAPGGSVATSFRKDAATQATIAVMTASANSGWTFLNWAGAVSGITATVESPIVRAQTVQVVFGASLNTSVNGNGAVQRNDDRVLLPYGTIVRVSAVPGAGSAFRFWGGSGINGAVISPINVAITNGPTSVAAFFATLPAGNFALTTLVNGNGFVTKSPQQQSYADGASVTLSATAAMGWHFVRWTGDAGTAVNPLVVAMSANKIVTAGFESDAVLPQGTSYRWEQPNYEVPENGGTITLKIIKSGTSAGSVNFFTAPQSAEPGRDYVHSQGTVNFAAGETNKTVTITLLDEFVPDGDRIFEVHLDSSHAGELAIPSVCQVKTIDNDASLEDSSFLDYAIVGNRPATRGELQVLLKPDEAAGQWRLPWELAWRGSGDLASDLDPGEYPVMFRARANYVSPEAPTYSVPGGVRVVRTNFYSVDAAVVSGSMRVVFAPIDLLGANAPGWRFAGDAAFHVNNELVSSISAGIQVVEFKNVSGWVRPLAREVLIQSGVETSLNVAYTLDSPPAGVFATPKLIDTYAQIHQSQQGSPAQPYALVGQLRSAAGYGSGIAVRDRVVLTAAHVLFDESTLDFVSGVDWFGERQAGQYEPRPIGARGWYVNTNYIYQRKIERAAGFAPGVSSIASQQWDVAALYFDQPVAHGGFSGYLLSDAADNEWLRGTQKELIGYPLSGGAEDGQMHVVAPFNYLFGAEGPRVYSTAGFLSYPGNSGGPLCVLFARSDGANIYYPAAVYLGNKDGRALARSIDKDVASLINRAASSAALGTNFVGGGVIGIGAGGGFGSVQLVHLTVQISPAAAVTAGASWRVKGSAAFSASGATLIVPAGDAQIEFKDAAGFTTPATRTITLVAGQDSTIPIAYVSNAAPAQFDRIDVIGNTLRLRVHRASAGTVNLERSSDLKSWTTLRTLDLPAGTAADFDVALPGDRAGFLRISSP
jgi:hypothetical protein